ncbi:MAG TPA: SRPBCC domain-containing protein [Candidatus Krumholzibacteria bacterium]|nr:SRPBCC domain-containing protein [Candidatus Krumholzibacteria bacterium]
MRIFVVCAAAAALSAALASAPARGQVKQLPTGAFSFQQSITLPGPPDEIFGAITGEIGGWWDHSFSEHPKRFHLEPKVGGCFCEVFDDAGNGVRHAIVTYVDRPKLLRFEGPLGLAGNATHMVFTYQFEPVWGDSTKLTLTGQGSGHVEPGWPDVVAKVWHHFLVERFKPYVEAGKHKAKP